MKKPFTLILFASLSACCFLPVTSTGQDFTQSELDIIRKKVDSLIYDYSWYGDFTENDRTISSAFMTNFKALFATDATVLNDIDILDAAPVISLNDYTDGVIDLFPSGIGMSVTDVVMKTPERIPAYNMGQVKADAVKSIIGMTKNEDVFEKQIQITMFFSFNLDMTNFRIAGIRELVIDNKEITFKVIDFSKGTPLPNVNMNLFYDNQLQQTRETNVDGEVKFTDIPPGSRISVSADENQDYVIETDKELVIEDWLARDEGGRKIYLKRLRVWTGMNLDLHGATGMSIIKSTNDESTYTADSYAAKGQLGYSFGIGFAYYFLKNEKIALGIGIGADMDILNGIIEFDSLVQDPYSGTQGNLYKDSEGQVCNLLYSSTQMENNLGATYLSSPLTIRFRFIFDKKFLDYIYLNAGVKYSYLFMSKSKMDGDVTYMGEYEQYYDLVLKDIAALGYYTDEPVNFENDLEISKGNLGIIASAGISIPLVNPFLNLDFGVDFNMGITDISDYDHENYYLSTSTNYKDIGSLAGTSQALRSQFIGFRIGISYDIFK